MKRIIILALFACASVCGLKAQVVDTTVCAIMQNPTSFDGKIVRVKGIAVGGLDNFIIKDSKPCGLPVDAIWLAYPMGTKAHAGPAAMVEVSPAHNYDGPYKAVTRTPVTLQRDKDFEKFDSTMSTEHIPSAQMLQDRNSFEGMCLGCLHATVTATFVGRLDGVASTAIVHDGTGKIASFGGFGNMNAYPARLVLQSVSDLAPNEINYDKTDETTKNEPPMGGQNRDHIEDPVDAARRSFLLVGGNANGKKVQQDIELFGARGAEKPEITGVNLVWGIANEADDNAPSSITTPDGLLFTVSINPARIEGYAQIRTLVHMGQHVSDLRTLIAANADAPLYVLEYNDWTLTAISATYNGQRSITLSGAFLLWETEWPAKGRGPLVDSAINNYLNMAGLWKAPPAAGN
jgi:hypothetical protein